MKWQTYLRPEGKNNFLFYSLILFCLTLPLDIKLNNIAIALTIIAWIVEGDFSQKMTNLKRNRMVLFLGAYYIFSAATLIYTSNIQYGLGVVESQLLFLIMPLVIGSTTSLDNAKIYRIKVVYVAWCLMVSVLLLGYSSLQYLVKGVSLFSYYNLTSAIDLHPIYLANYMTLAGLIVYFTDFGMDRVRQNWVKAICLVYILIFTSMLSAISVLLFIVLTSVFVINNKLPSVLGLWKTLAMNVLFILIIASVVLAMPYTRTKLTKSMNLEYHMDDPDSSWNSVTIRLAKWSGGIQTIRKSPILGVGVGDEKDQLMNSYAELNFREGIRCEYNVHNQYLSSWMSGGVFLLLLLGAILILPLRYGLKKKNYLLVSFLALMSLSFLTENFLMVNKGVAFFSFFYSVLVVRRDQLD